MGTPETPKQSQQAEIKITATCKECGTEQDEIMLDAGKSAAKIIPCEFCETDLSIPMIWVKQ